MNVKPKQRTVAQLRRDIEKCKNPVARWIMQSILVVRLSDERKP